MNVTDTLTVKDSKEWRAWLQKNYKTALEIWLVNYLTGTGKKTISYNESVEEALCFGWIDSIVHKLDDESFVQRYSPRRKGKSYSQLNIERLRLLLEQGKVMPEVIPTLPDVDGFVEPEDVIAALKADADAWKNWKMFQKPYQRIRLAYVDGARKRPEEFKKRLENLVKKTSENKQFGLGGNAKYY